jgi:hypothetical protein
MGFLIKASQLMSSFRDGPKDQTRKLEIPGSLAKELAPRNDEGYFNPNKFPLLSAVHLAAMAPP